MFKQRILKMSSKEFEKLSKFLYTDFLFYLGILIIITAFFQNSFYGYYIVFLAIFFGIIVIDLVFSVNKALRYILHKKI